MILIFHKSIFMCVASNFINCELNVPVYVCGMSSRHVSQHETKSESEGSTREF